MSSASDSTFTTSAALSLAFSWTLLVGCKAYDPSPADGTFASCCGGHGSCVPSALVPSTMRELLAADSCGEALVCAPLSLLDDPFAVFASCHAAGNLEGRCLPSCLPQIAERASKLERRSCREGELCAPCFDPRTGKDTDACRIADDPGPQESRRTFAACCGAHGRCLPREILAESVTTSDLKRLRAADCLERDALCTPEKWLSNAERTPVRCRLAGDFEGRCLSSCLPDVAGKAESLERRSCSDGDLCVPCYDPMSGEDTGACRIDGDRPAGPARTLASCCDERARCVPPELLERSIDSGDLDRLERAECRDDGSMCVPNAWLAASRPAPVECRAPGDLEGRCLSSCLPEVAAHADSLAQTSCDADARCVPCYDPRTGEDSGACHIAGDAPRVSARTFDACCGERARCVPHELVPRDLENALEHVGRLDCIEHDALCIPESWLDREPPPPAACRAPGDLEGRCLLACLPDVAQRLDGLAQASCDEDERCVPCYDPRTGEASGACATSLDQPQEEPKVFGACCGDRAMCVPREILAQAGTDRLELFGQDSCADAESLCAPTRWLDNEKPAACRAPGDLEGRCIPECLPAVAAQLDGLRPSTCDAGERCVPCFDPVHGTESGACRIAGDEPAEPSRGFDVCCNAAGRCLPSELLTSAQLDELPADRCDAQAARCAPTQLLTTDSSATFAACNTGSAADPGLCIPECFLPSEALSLLSRASCSSSERCVGCSRLPVGFGVTCP